MIDFKKQRPYPLPCGDTICKVCFDNMGPGNLQQMNCPACNENLTFNKNKIKANKKIMNAIQSTNNLYFKLAEILENKDSLVDNLKTQIENLEPLIMKMKYGE